MPNNKGHKKVRIQVDLDVEIAKALKIRAVQNLQTLTKFITEWVRSWDKKKK
jgi:DNA-directed RNA polymerase subunit L